MQWRLLVSALLLGIGAIAQSPNWAQCAGDGWTGPTTCNEGWVCTYNNQWYSQCLPAPPPQDPPGLPTSNSTVNSLDALAKSVGKLYFGTATDNPGWTNADYVAILTSDMFGQITPGNALKWGPTNPSPGVFTYTDGDACVSLAQNSTDIIRGHNLIWDTQLPSWINDTLTSDQLLDAMNTHITDELTRYKGQMYAWDVVNEPFSDSGGMKDWLFQDVVGTDYIAEAFITAHAADPDAKLYLNDYNLEYTGAKFSTAVETVTSLLAEGVPIHGIGFEGHMIVGSVPSASALAAQMNAFTSLGLEVAFTEIDIRMPVPATAELFEQQKADYQSMVTACMMVSGCVGMTVWDFTDADSWIPAVFTGYGDACPWDVNLNRKPAYDGIVDGLNYTPSTLN